MMIDKKMSDPTVTTYGDFDIAIRTSEEIGDHALSRITASFSISSAGFIRCNTHVVTGFGTAEEAAANALREAKEIVDELGDGLLPH
jgi:hypothetical protein